MLKRTMSVILCLIIVLSIPLQSFAATVCYTNFYSAEYSSNPGQYMANIALAQNGRTGSDLGYSDQWCAYFVSDCARIAGQTAAIPAHGNVLSLYNNITNAGGVTIYDARNGTGSLSNAKIGDIAVLDTTTGSNTSRDHVEIVYAVSGSSIYTVGGNSGSGSCYSTRKVTKHSPYSSSRIVYIVRPNYSGITNSPPTNAWVSLPNGPESTYYLNEFFNITVGSDNATEYYLHIYKDQDLYWSCSRASTSGSLDIEVVFDKPGHYSCFVEAINSAGYTYSDWIGWNIVGAPENAWVSIPNGPESSYKTYSPFYITFGADNATEYYLNIYDSEGHYYTSYQSSTSGRAKIEAEFYEPGHYSCFVEAFNPVGSVMSEWVGWDIVVDVPTDLSISVDREEKMYRIDENVNFNLYANLGYYKHIGIHRVGGGLYAESDVAGNSFSINITEPGNYYANFDAFNACGSARSEMVYFTVVDSVPDYSEISIVGGNATEYNVGDTITFQMNTKNEHSKYIGIHKNSTFYTGGYIDEDTYSYTFTEAGSYLVSFDALNNYGYTRSNSVTFDIYEPYKVQYIASDATNVPSQQIKKHNTEIYLVHEMPTKDGYIFKCWNTAADGGGVSYNPGDTYTENADLTLYAVWESATLLLANTQLTADRDNGIIYGTDLLGMSQGDLENQFSNDSLKIAMTDDYHIGTGTIIELVDSKGNACDSLTVVIFGDIDGNGWYDANDAFLVNMINAGLISVDNLGIAERTAADCNHDGKIDQADFELLVQAGILLDEVKQSAENGDISTTSLYIDCCSVISQSAEIDTEADNNNISDTTNSEEVTYTFDFISFFHNILGLLSKIFGFIVALF